MASQEMEDCLASQETWDCLLALVRGLVLAWPRLQGISAVDEELALVVRLLGARSEDKGA